MALSQAERDRRYLRSPKGRYQQQKRRAWQRGIGWRLTFEQWWQIWQASGHWHERGKHKGNYIMARLRDAGHYEQGNVYITKLEANSYDCAQRYRNDRAHLCHDAQGIPANV